ncbi:CD109 antigen [Nymphon striatum]|nr:CD109 antigen [Nymphon striatum]
MVHLLSVLWIKNDLKYIKKLHIKFGDFVHHVNIFSKIAKSHLTRRGYFIIAPRVIRPGHVYSVVVTLTKIEYTSIYIRSFVSRNGVQIASDIEKLTLPETSYRLLMKIPGNSPAGEYKVRVDGGLSKNGGFLFKEEAPLTFSHRSLTILIQTNKAIYNFHHMGVVSIAFKLPTHPTSGWWTIKIIAQGQVVEEKIWVRRSLAPNYIVHVDAPAFVLNSENYISGTVQVNKTKTLAPIYGKLVLYAQIKLKNSQKYVAEVKETEKIFDGVHNFRFPLSELRQLHYPLDGVEVEIRARAIEYFTNNTHSGYVRVKIINEKLHFRFLGTSPQIFKPGMPFVTNVAISYHDRVALDASLLSRSTLTIKPIAISSSGSSSYMSTINTNFSESGVFQIRVRAPNNANKIRFVATYSDGYYTTETELLALAANVLKKKHIHVTTSTTMAMVGEYAVFHLRTNFHIDSFHYVVMSKGIIQSSATESVEGYNKIIHSFAVPVSPAMSPSATLVVYTIFNNEVISDSVTVPVNGISRNLITSNINDGKDKTGKTIELNIVNYPGAMAFVSSLDTASFSGQSKNEVNQYHLLDEMYKFEENRNRLQRIVWRSRDSLQSTRHYFVTPNYGYDSYATFEIPVVSFSQNPNEPDSTTELPDWMRGSATTNYQTRYMSCSTGKYCYPIEKRCNGVNDCQDKSDEANCVNDELRDLDSTIYHMFRKNMQPLKYDATGKDFGWSDIAIGFNQDTQIGINIPRRPTNWRFNVYSMHSELGFGIISQPVIHNARIPFYMTAEAPRTAVIYEQIGIRVSVFNFMAYEIEVLLVLEKSEKFRFVRVEGLGVVSHYDPKTTQNNIHHLIFVKPHSHKIVHVPVVAISEGQIEVVIKGRTQVGMDSVKVKMNIQTEGAMQRYHTSLLLNLRNIPSQLSYLNINVTETPIVPYELYRRYVWGSPKGQVSVSGDVVGPAFPKFPVTPADLRLTNIMSGEIKAFDFAYHLLTLRYLWITNQWDPALGKKVFNYLQVSYSDTLGHFKKNYFFQFHANKPSVWLTAHMARIFQVARYPEWENFLYIDPSIISKSIEYLVSQQQPDGSFYDVEEYAFDRKMNPTVSYLKTYDLFGNPTGRRAKREENITLTAHVLLTLLQATDLNGELRIKASSAKVRALNYIKQKLPLLTDPYALSIVTYVLVSANNVLGEKAFTMLDSIKRSESGLIYWAKEPVPPDDIFIQNQRPYIVPRKKSRYDSRNVEATAYALLTYIRKEGLVQDRIVEWLLKVKYSDVGFCSTRDTLVAMEALIEYSYRSRVREVTDLQVKIEASSLPGQSTIFSINQDNLSKQQKLVMPNVHGSLESVANGGGLALLQLDVSFGVDRNRVMVKPPVNAFDLNVKYLFSGRNNSHLHVNACVRWNLLEESERSGFSMLELQLPSGYYLWHNHMVAAMNQFPNVTKGDIRERVANIYFESIGHEFNCVNFTVNRWYPVANLTRFMLARVYEYFSPEYFTEEIIDVYAVHVLSICQVCGSYQCPYCPDFSRATIDSGSIIFIVLSSSLIILQSYLQFSQIAARIVRRALKPDKAAEAMKREGSNVKTTFWKDGKAIS